MKKIVYMPEECIGENIYRKRINPLQDIRVRDLKEVPREATSQFFTLFFSSNLDMIYNREFIDKWVMEQVKIFGNPEPIRKEWEEQVEEIKTLMKIQYIKENLSEFESEAFLNGKTEVFYVSKNPLGKNDESIGTVSECSWYDPIRATRVSDHVGKCSEQYAGDIGVFQTELDVEFAVWHNNVYYFF